MIHEHFTIDISYDDDNDAITWVAIGNSGKLLEECEPSQRELLERGLEHYFSKDREAKYFVSYAVLFKNGKSGFGSSMITVEGRISEMDDITYLQDAIVKSDSNLNNVVILNYKLIE